MRYGANPRTPSAHWFTGEGMLHAVRLEDGRAAWYRNRYVRTESFADPPHRTSADMGHNVPQEAPEAFARAVVDADRL